MNVLQIGCKVPPGQNKKIISCSPSEIDDIVEKNKIDVAIVMGDILSEKILQYHERFPIIAICNREFTESKIYRCLSPSALNSPILDFTITSAVASHGNFALTAQQAQIQMDAIFRAIPDAIIFCNGKDPAHVVKLANLSFTRIFGWTLDEIKNQVPSFLFEETGYYVKLMNQVDRLANFDIITERAVKMNRRDGALVVADITIVKVPDIKPFGFIMVITDRTQQKRQEHRLMFLRKVVERINEPVFILDDSGLIHWANEAGIKKTNIKEKSIELMHPVDAGLFNDVTFWQMWKAVKNEREYAGQEFFAIGHARMTLLVFETAKP